MRISDWSSDVCSSDLTARLNLWLNPVVDAATSASDFDLREVRARHMSIYLGVSPDNIDRIAPVYSLFLQQLVDLNTRDLPDAASNVPVLILLDEFARLGTASVIAGGFSYRSEEHTSELQSLMRI